MKNLSLLIVSILVISCTQVYKPVELPLPPPLTFKLTDSELSCLSDDTYQKIVVIDKRRKTLRGILESTH